MPRRILYSHRVRWAALIFLGYWLVAAFVKPIQLAQVLTICLVFVAVGVVAKYTRQVYVAIIHDEYDAISQLAQGIWLGFLGLLVGLIWAMVGRVVPGAEWMQRSPVVGFYLLCYLVAGTLHMTARRDERGRFLKDDVRDVFLVYFGGLLVSILLLAAQLGGVLREP